MPLPCMFFCVSFLILSVFTDIYSDSIFIDLVGLASYSVQLKWACVIHDLVIYFIYCPSELLVAHIFDTSAFDIFVQGFESCVYRWGNRGLEWWGALTKVTRLLWLGAEAAGIQVPCLPGRGSGVAQRWPALGQQPNADKGISCHGRTPNCVLHIPGLSPTDDIAGGGWGMGLFLSPLRRQRKKLQLWERKWVS